MSSSEEEETFECGFTFDDDAEQKIVVGNTFLDDLIKENKLSVQVPTLEDRVRVKKEEDFFDEEIKVEDTLFSSYTTFEAFGLSKVLLKALKKLEFVTPTPIQQAVIPVAMMGRDVCGGAETGSGKTAAFLLPILERLLRLTKRNVRRTRVLVLLPTRELALQCSEVLTKLTQCCAPGQITHGLAVGGMPLREQASQIRHSPDIVIATPGRLLDHLLNTPGFDLLGVEILVLDEADRMLEEGFKDELEEILRQLPDTEHRQSILLSASMTSDVDELARLSLKKPVRLQVDSAEAIARGLEQHFVRVRQETPEERISLLLALAHRHTCTESKCKAIVFLPTKEAVHRTRVLLGLLGLNALELHGGMSQPERITALESFKKHHNAFMVATDVAARGLDIPGVNLVLCYSMPANYRQYLHRVGRTARAGTKGLSITLCGEADRKQLKVVMKNSKTPIKQRSLPLEVMEQYRKMLAGELGSKAKEIIEREKEEKELKRVEDEMRRTSNMIEHAEEIKARPPRTWFQTRKEKRMAKKKERVGNILRRSK